MEFVFKTFGADKKKLKKLIDAAELPDGAAVSYKYADFECDVVLKLPDEFSGAGALKNSVSRVLRAYLYGAGNTTLAHAVAALLHKRCKKAAFAESFTAGGIVNAVLAFPNASEIVEEGIVAYSDGAKMRRLGVDKKILDKHTAVSQEVAAEMCYNLLSSSGAGLSVATTGYAGPDGDPVGECYIALGTFKGIHVYKYDFAGTRAEIALQGVKTALFLITRALQDDAEYENLF